MKLVFFCHAITSCWNNGNAHFLRGVMRELVRLGHRVVGYECAEGWSRLNAIRDGGERALVEAAGLLSEVVLRRYREESFDVEAATEGADVVIVHEWTEPWLIRRLRQCRLGGASFRLLFHDTHHRAVTAPEQIPDDHLDGFDGALVFGAALRDVYRRRNLAQRVFVWHEAADTALFRPARADKACDLIWIGNWGDEERTRELHQYLIEPVGQLDLTAQIYGVRYPQEAQDLLRARRIPYRGWLPNHRVPDAFARSRATVHIPRGPYVCALPGIPTIRVFEALACGIPLVCAPWEDCERLFPSGVYLTARSSAQMTQALADVLNHDDLAAELSRNGLRAIEKAHTCGHRAAELVAIVDALSPPTVAVRPSPELQVAS